jgi:PCFT/HCP family folate transporter-like MFS transporter 1/3
MSKDQKIDFKNKTISQKIAHIIKNISVEPTLVFYVAPAMLSALATQNLFLEKACRTNLGFEDEVCDALTARNTANYTEEEKSVQSIVATLQGWKTVFQSLLPCIFILFWGSWSDRHGRRK